MKFIQLTFLLLLISNVSFGQEKTISGKIVDQAGLPISFVSVSFKKLTVLEKYII